MFGFRSSTTINECKICGKKSIFISDTLKLCVECIRHDKASHNMLINVHGNIRKKFNLPPLPPKNKGINCDICSNECNMAPGDIGYCGLRWNEEGKPRSLVSSEKALLLTYLDSLPTNCCASWFCPGCTDTGYPEYTYSHGTEYGYTNLAVFFYACNFDCLYCQNHYHKDLNKAPYVDIDGFKKHIKIIKNISCVCFFGGSPEPQLPFAIKASEQVQDLRDILRICWEWNGCGNKKLVDKAAKISIESGGNIKFDLKCFNENLSFALTGVSNRASYENFERLAARFNERQDMPFLSATTLMVPGYVDEVEVASIAKFIAELNDEIPYSLLVFHPDFMMRDMPVTPKKQTLKCLEEAQKHLKNVNIGNIQFLDI
ncbi:MAG: radical SAM protein [Euryarchaeota archaeon]|nr:radical SAM protein [Euryarchaeota archaeon]